MTSEEFLKGARVSVDSMAGERLDSDAYLFIFFCDIFFFILQFFAFFGFYVFERGCSSIIFSVVWMVLLIHILLCVSCLGNLLVVEIYC